MRPKEQELNIASHVLLQNDRYVFKAFIFFLSKNTVRKSSIIELQKIYSLSRFLFDVSP